MAGYASTPGNRGLWMLRRDGDDYQTAVFYPEDDRFLVERDPVATHYQVDTQVATGSG